MISMARKRSMVCAVAVALSAASCAGDTAGPSVRSAPLPSLSPGEPCPVTEASDPLRPSLGLGDMLGNAPVRPVGFKSGARFVFATGNAHAGSHWGGGKVVWAVEPGFDERVVINGRRIDGPELVRFGRAKDDSLVLPAAPNGANDTANLQGWRSFPSEVRVEQEGCYAFQIGTSTAAFTVVFIASRSTTVS